MHVRVHVFVFTLCIACYTVSVKDQQEATSFNHPPTGHTRTTAVNELSDRSKKVKNTQKRIIVLL